MSPEQLKEKMNSPKLREIVLKQTDLLCDAYQQGWEDCWDLFAQWLKERGIKL